MMVLGDITRVGDTVVGVIAEVSVDGVKAGDGLVVSGRKVPKYVLVKGEGECQVFGLEGENIPNAEIEPEAADLIADFSSSSI